MNVAQTSIRKNPQRSEWPTELSSHPYRTQSSIILTKNDGPGDEREQTRTQYKSSTPRKISPFLTFIIGLLLTGIVAAVAFTLWLTPIKTTTTTPMTTTTTTTTTTTSTSTSTDSSTTSSTSTDSSTTSSTSTGSSTTSSTSTDSSTTSTTSVTTTTVTTSTTSITTTTTTIITPTVDALWSFDSNTNDQYGIYNAVPFNGPTYVTGYTGQSNTALYFDGSQTQCVSMSSSFVNLTYNSFTVEMWFYPTMLTSGDFGLFGQCQTPSQDLCLIYMIRNYRILLAFNADDTSGLTNICINQWYHVAFVYDYPTSTQSIYLNGLLENSRASNAYQGTSGDILIGAITNGPMQYFTGYIDQVSLMTRSKSAAEILMDATLVCYYSFDSNPYTDSGPLYLTATGVGLSIANGTGRINSAISFTTASSYFVVGGLTRLGTFGQAYSISIWIKPTSVNGGTIAHVSECNYNCGYNWCLAFIGFTSSGQIAVQSWSGFYNNNLAALTGPVLSINVWTHVVQTYSSINGMRLFLNGISVNQSETFIYSASNAPNYLYLGSFPLTLCVPNIVITQGQYYGLLDEFYLFARDLTPAEVYQLANP